MEEIYFDCASTIRPYKEALDVFNKVSIDSFANDSSTHMLGIKSHELLQKARAQVSKYLKVLSEEVIFTSCASESNNTAIKGVAYRNRSWANRLITTKGEHPSVLNVFKELEREGFEVVYLDYDRYGRLNLDQLKDSLNDKTSLVSVMSVNNEVGYIFPIEEISKIVKENSRALLHVDITQSVGKEDIDLSYIDLASFSGHKIGALKGSGVLIKKKGIFLNPLIVGGSQEDGYRAGTTALPLYCSLATALRISLKSMKERRENAIKINEKLKEGLKEIDEVEITSLGNCSPFILSFALTKHKGSVIAEALSNRGIYVSTRSACSAREKGYSYVLKEAGYDDTIASNGIRLSFSGNETVEQCDTFLKALKEILEQVKIKEI